VGSGTAQGHSVIDVLSESGESFRLLHSGGRGPCGFLEVVVVAVLVLKKGVDMERRTGLSVMGVRKGSVLLN
jgi:hypothetical protein